ncbi:uncharacterized protein LOC106056110 [Biomphalaria glabrata]|uniref:Uncharacterized protein LOC106056110 n=1 Tax=Biomphalaria glabrata TaxID=6526 RepID=A0A9W3A2T5_BIOGL|nr:uncharacterized protein LOC106056110 [Biomphalaria glabrata]
MKRSPALKTLVAVGFTLGDVLLIADLLKDNGNQISADKKMWKSRRHQNQAVYITVPGGDSEKGVTRFQELLTTLKDQKTCCNYIFVRIKKLSLSSCLVVISFLPVQTVLQR